MNKPNKKRGASIKLEVLFLLVISTLNFKRALFNNHDAKDNETDKEEFFSTSSFIKKKNSKYCGGHNGGTAPNGISDSDFDGLDTHRKEI